MALRASSSLKSAHALEEKQKKNAEALKQNARESVCLLRVENFTISS
jgi:hypothetical protein